MSAAKPASAGGRGVVARKKVKKETTGDKLKAKEEEYRYIWESSSRCEVLVLN